MIWEVLEAEWSIQSRALSASGDCLVSPLSKQTYCTEGRKGGGGVQESESERKNHTDRRVTQQKRVK